jgi:hypothetical protein
MAAKVCLKAGWNETLAMIFLLCGAAPAKLSGRRRQNSTPAQSIAPDTAVLVHKKQKPG